MSTSVKFPVEFDKGGNYDNQVRSWVNALAERVAKLEVGRAELHDRCDVLSDALGHLEQDALQPIREDASGQLASAGEAHRESQNGSCYCDACCVKAGLAPAEQPSRQETGGVAGGACADYCGRCGAGDHDASACRDRAKAKAAEQARPSWGEWMTTPAEPSGAGQVPPAQQPPMVAIERTLNGADGQASLVCRLPDSRLIRIDVETDGCVTTYGSNGTPIYRELPGYEPIAEPPAPAAGTLSDRIRERCRFYTDDIRRGWTALAVEVAALEARLVPDCQEVREPMTRTKLRTLAPDRTQQGGGR